MQTLHLVAVLCCLAMVFAVPTADQIKWCVLSAAELHKCNDLAQRAPAFSCVLKDTPIQCIAAIKAGQADAVTLNGEYIYKAGLINYNLVPIIAETYNSVANHEGCSYSVAVVRKDAGFFLNDLRGRKSCHTGLDTPEGWTFPVGTLLTSGLINWEGTDFQPVKTAVSQFFSASCVPGVDRNLHPNLCQLCGDDCSKSTNNKYFGGAGALKCLAEGTGDVAFMNPADIPEEMRSNYELLCQDNTAAPVDHYQTCNLGQEKAHAVVTRSGLEGKQLVENIWTTLTTVRGINLFSSENYGDKNLLFSDSTARLVQVPFGTDWFLYLGDQYAEKLQALHKARPPPGAIPGIRWCAVGHLEKDKCDKWSGCSLTEDGDTAIECQEASSVEECFKKIMRKEADAIAVDGGQVYTAGICGLVPAMVEQYDEGKCSSSNAGASSYYAVAVIKKGSGMTWDTLRGNRSCHTGFGRTAGWNIPMGRIYEKEHDCDFTKFFKSGCAPGIDDTGSSPFCTNCKGNGEPVGDTAKCKAIAEEQYYGYAGAFRCLVEGAGDVAFIKHTIVAENTNGHGPAWASNERSEEYELICPGKTGSVPIGEYESCNLALVPAHAVMTRPDIRTKVVDILNKEQTKTQRLCPPKEFEMFKSNGRNLLFKDSTKCLQVIPTDSYETFLGNNYLAAMKSLRACTTSTPDLEKSCTFQSCQ